MSSLHDKAYQVAAECEQLATQPKAFDSMKHAIARALADAYCTAVEEFSWYDGVHYCGFRDNRTALDEAKRRAYVDAGLRPPG
jgi:hypothetical protein